MKKEQIYFIQALISGVGSLSNAFRITGKVALK